MYDSQNSLVYFHFVSSRLDRKIPLAITVLSFNKNIILEQRKVSSTLSYAISKYKLISLMKINRNEQINNNLRMALHSFQFKIHYLAIITSFTFRTFYFLFSVRQPDVDYIYDKKGALHLLINGFMFHQSTGYRDKIYWSCAQKRKFKYVNDVDMRNNTH